MLAFSVVLGARSVAAAPEPPVVAAITFDGRNHVPEDVVEHAIQLRVGAPFSATQLEADRKSILALGYFRSVGAAQSTAEGKTRVTFRLVELPKVVHIRITGNSVVELKAIQDVISTRLGQVLCGPQLQNDVRAIERLYRERGYVGRVSEKLVDEAASSGILRFEILEIRIGELVVEGGTERQRDHAREVLTEVPPTLYRPEAVGMDQQRLLRVRGVHAAVPKVETLEPGKVRIRWILNPPRSEAPAADKG